MAKRFLRNVPSSTDAAGLDLVQTKRPRHVRIVNFPTDVRQYKHNLQSRFSEDVDVEAVFDFFNVAIARSLVAVARFAGSSALPVCALIPWLHSDETCFCKSCEKGYRLEGAGFLEYVKEHASTIRFEDYVSCVHRGMAWQFLHSLYLFQPARKHWLELLPKKTRTLSEFLCSF